jgi:hypothetical protein
VHLFGRWDADDGYFFRRVSKMEYVKVDWEDLPEGSRLERLYLDVFRDYLGILSEEEILEIKTQMPTAMLDIVHTTVTEILVFGSPALSHIRSFSEYLVQEEGYDDEEDDTKDDKKYEVDGGGKAEGSGAMTPLF